MDNTNNILNIINNINPLNWGLEEYLPPLSSSSSSSQASNDLVAEKLDGDNSSSSLSSSSPPPSSSSSSSSSQAPQAPQASNDIVAEKDKSSSSSSSSPPPPPSLSLSQGPQASNDIVTEKVDSDNSSSQPSSSSLSASSPLPPSSSSSSPSSSSDKNNDISEKEVAVVVRSLIRQDDGNEKPTECFCYDNDNLIGDRSNPNRDHNQWVNDMRLGCSCPVHYNCLVKYIKSKLGDLLNLHDDGIVCPWGRLCLKRKENGDSYYMTSDDLDMLVNYADQINTDVLDSLLKQVDCSPLSNDDVQKLRDWTNRAKTPAIISEENLDPYVRATTKACPNCSYRSTHHHLHDCHHISPGQGCPNCKINYCYKCLKTEIENESERGNRSHCDCGSWSTNCEPIRSQEDIDEYLVLDPIPFDSRCGCTICPDCRFGSPCGNCNGDCSVCRGHLPPAPAALGLPYDVTYSTTLSARLRRACKQGNMVELSRLMNEVKDDDKFNINRKDARGRTVLHLAAEHGKKNVIELLLRLQPNIDKAICDKNGDTACHLAAIKGHSDVVDFFLSLEDSTKFMNIKNKIGQTLSHLSSYHGHPGVLKILIEKQFNINATDKRNTTSLFYSSLKGKRECVEILLNCPDVNVNVRDIDHDTALIASVIGNFPDITELLVNIEGINLNSINKKGHSALFIACFCGNSRAAKLLLDKGTAHHHHHHLIIIILISSSSSHHHHHQVRVSKLKTKIPTAYLLLVPLIVLRLSSYFLKKVSLMSISPTVRNSQPFS